MDHKFQPRASNGVLMPEIEYSALIYIVGTEAHRLALHRSVHAVTLIPVRHQPWHVSDPVTGLHVRTVKSFFKGVPVSSAGLTLTEARKAAMATLDEFLEQVGSDKFNNTLKQARIKWAPSGENHVEA